MTPNSVGSSPNLDRRTSSPVETVVNFLGDVKKDLEASLRLRDVYILDTAEQLFVLQVVLFLLFIVQISSRTYGSCD